MPLRPSRRLWCCSTLELTVDCHDQGLSHRHKRDASCHSTGHPGRPIIRVLLAFMDETVANTSRRFKANDLKIQGERGYNKNNSAFLQLCQKLFLIKYHVGEHLPINHGT